MVETISGKYKKKTLIFYQFIKKKKKSRTYSRNLLHIYYVDDNFFHFFFIEAPNRLMCAALYIQNKFRSINMYITAIFVYTSSSSNIALVNIYMLVLHTRVYIYIKTYINGKCEYNVYFKNGQGGGIRGACIVTHQRC